MTRWYIYVPEIDPNTFDIAVDPVLESVGTDGGDHITGFNFFTRFILLF